MTGPVEIAVEAVRQLRYADLRPTLRRAWAEVLTVVEAALTALHAAGWRIVRGEVVEGSVDGCPEWLCRITDEWEPGVSESPVAPAGQTPPSAPASPAPAEEKLTDLMAALDESVREAIAARDRHVAARQGQAPCICPTVVAADGSHLVICPARATTEATDAG